MIGLGPKAQILVPLIKRLRSYMSLELIVLHANFTSFHIDFWNDDHVLQLRHTCKQPYCPWLHQKDMKHVVLRPSSLPLSCIELIYCALAMNSSVQTFPLATIRMGIAEWALWSTLTLSPIRMPLEDRRYARPFTRWAWSSHTFRRKAFFLWTHRH